jgi:EpsI family protein
MIHKKRIIVLILLLATIILSFAVPQSKYIGTNFISNLNIPFEFSEWMGKDVTSYLNINTEETQFNFINDALARNFVSMNGQPLIFIVLDAGNFHHPKNCFTSAGYKIKELNDTEFHTLNRTFKTHTLYTERAGESFLSFYWIVIDKKIVHQWVEQKLKQLYFSMFNKKRVGLMIRIDIPTREDNIESATILAKQFINDLGQIIPPENADYMFGRK